MRIPDRLHEYFENEQGIRKEEWKKKVEAICEPRDIERDISYEERSDIDDGFKRFLASVGYY